MDATRRLTMAALDMGEKPSVISAICKYHMTERMRTILIDAMDILHSNVVDGFCLVSSDSDYTRLATRIRDTAFKKTLAELDIGAEVDVEHPKGDFSLPLDTARPYVFIAGGIGITVFRCMLRYIVEEGLSHRVTLVYSNRDRESTAFFDELETMDREQENISVVFVMTDDPEWEGEKRRVDADFLREHLDGELGDYVHIAAGPPGLVEAMESALKDAGVPEEQVLAQRFAGY